MCIFCSCTVCELDLYVIFDYNLVKIISDIGDGAMKSLHYKLFIRYAALIFPTILVFMFLLYIILGHSLQTNTKNELQADCDNISTFLDTQMDTIDQLSKRIVSSSQLRQAFQQDLYSGSADAYFRNRAFSQDLFDIIKLSFNDMSLNMMDIEGRYIHVSATSEFRRKDPDFFKQADWFQETLDAYGKKILLPPRMPDLDSGEVPVISLCRAFAIETLKNETAVLEIQLQYPSLENRLEKIIHNEKRKQIYIYDQRGNLIYPYQEPPDEEIEKYLIQAACVPDVGRAPVTFRPKEGANLLLACRYSPYTEWTVFVTASEKELLSSFYLFRFFIIMASVFLLLILSFITYRIAEKLSKPLKSLEQSAASLTFDNLDTFKMPDYKNNFRELDSLYHSFEQMKDNLQNSLENVVRARTVANDATILALQAQMNPHFLYNTLASIGALAENEENEKIVEMCDSLSSILRYSSSGILKNVTLEQEIEQTYSYIRLIEIKYEERIQFRLDIDEEIFETEVPKQLIQPLVENCVKYALDVPPPWIISVSGYADDAHLIIQVTDNGSGFSEEYLEKFSAWIHNTDFGKTLPELSINGMGLFNLYARLFLKYRENIIFDLKNIPAGGACVRIGIPLSGKETGQ